MKGFLAFVVCLVVTNGYVPNYGQYEAEWLAWKSFHDKKYETQREDDARHYIWWDNFKASFKFIYWIRKINLIHEGFSATIVPLYCTFLSAVSSVHATKYSKTFSVQFKLWGPGSSSPWCNLYLHYVVIAPIRRARKNVPSGIVFLMRLCRTVRPLALKKLVIGL